MTTTAKRLRHAEPADADRSKLGFFLWVRVVFHALFGGARGAAKVLAKSKAFHVDIDPKDPDFAPVDGIGVDDYARINHDVWKRVKDAKSGAEEWAKVLADHRVDKAAYDAAAKVWNDRIDRNGHVQMRYANTFMAMG